LKTTTTLKVVPIKELLPDSVTDQFNRTLRRSPKYPDISVFVDAQGNEYGLETVDGKDQMVLLEGDFGLEYRWGVDTNWLGFLPGAQQELLSTMLLVESLLTERQIFVRQDWLGQYSTSIAVDRAAKPAPPITVDRKLQRKCSDRCIFSPDKIRVVTPEPRIEHPEAVIFQDDKGEVISVSNLYPFMYHHFVTVTPDHPAAASDFEVRHLMTFLCAGQKLAQIIRDTKDSVGMIGIWNWGELAAASQGHLHFQFGGRTPLMISCATKERKAVDELSQKLKQDPFSALIDGIRQTSLYCWENEAVFVHAPFAPVFPDQIDIVMKENIPNLLEIPDELMAATAEGLWRSLICLTISRSVTDFNLIIHQDDFEPQSPYYRLHFHIFPRNKRREGGLEFEGTYVVDIFPETTARALRQAMGPTKQGR